jgi:hypothetical protein
LQAGRNKEGQLGLGRRSSVGRYGNTIVQDDYLDRGALTPVPRFGRGASSHDRVVGECNARPLNGQKRSPAQLTKHAPRDHFAQASRPGCGTRWCC